MKTPTSANPTGLHPFEKLRRLAAKQVDELIELRESLSAELNFVDHERFAKALIAMTKLVEQLFAPEGDAPSRKTGDELKKEDDAIRAEFARRLAAMLRGRQIAATAEGDPEGAPASNSE
jgi:hypothetical protein